MDFIEAIERALGKKAKKNLMPIQPGDVPATWADVEDLARDMDYAPGVEIEEGVDRFIRWYLGYFKAR